MQKELQKKGPFLKNRQGTFDADEFVKLAAIINKYGYKAFLPAKEGLFEKRLGFLRQQDMRQYAQCIAQTNQ